MTSFRRLPPVLRVARFLRLLFPLGVSSVFLFPISASLWSSTHLALDVARLAVVGINFGVIGAGCILVVRTFEQPMQDPGQELFSLATWQSQIRALATVCGVPSFAAILALAIPPTSRAFQVVFPISIIGAILLLVFILIMRTRPIGGN